MSERDSGGYDRPSWEDDDVSELRTDGDPEDAIDAASENALAAWPSPVTTAPDEPVDEPEGHEVEDEDLGEVEDEHLEVSRDSTASDPLGQTQVAPAFAPEEQLEPEPLPEESAPEPDADPEPLHVEQIEHTGEHAPGDLTVPPGYPVLEGEPIGARRAVGIVVAKFNGEVTTKLLESALAELDEAGVQREHVTVMPVPGAFELPVAAMALAKTRRFACIVALGAVIRGDTPHFDYICAEAASGLQVAALETGVPVAFGVLTLDRADQAEHRYDKGAESVRTALEMADLFANLRAAAAR